MTEQIKDTSTEQVETVETKEQVSESVPAETETKSGESEEMRALKEQVRIEEEKKEARIKDELIRQIKEYERQEQKDNEAIEMNKLNEKLEVLKRSAKPEPTRPEPNYGFGSNDNPMPVNSKPNEPMSVEEVAKKICKDSYLEYTDPARKSGLGLIGIFVNKAFKQGAFEAKEVKNS